MYIINDEERSTDGGKSYNKGHFAEQTISEREYQDREANMEGREPLEAKDKLIKCWRRQNVLGNWKHQGWDD